MASSSPASPPSPPLHFVLTGHVDHGKSSIIGRLLHDAGALPQGKHAAMEEMCRRRGVSFQWAFLMDALQAERDQGVTIDSSWIRFHSSTGDGSAMREFILIDAPGHERFVRNMITGADKADAALLVVDAGEGLQEQSFRHGFLLHLMGVRQLGVVINKMDLVGYDQGRFEALAAQVRAYLARLDMEPLAVLPVSAVAGDNIVRRGDNMPWYRGATMLEALGGFSARSEAADLPLRLPIQDVYRFDDERILVGRIESGRLQCGDRLLFSPSNQIATVTALKHWPQAQEGENSAAAGRCIGITLKEKIFIERGELASHMQDAPLESDVFRARMFWLSSEPLRPGDACELRLGGMRSMVDVESLEWIVDPVELSRRPAEELAANEIGEVVLRARRMLALDSFDANPATGRFVLARERQIQGGGAISLRGYTDRRAFLTRRATNITRMAHQVTLQERSKRIGHKSGVLWFTGLSGAGKSTLALTLERRLHDRGFQVFVLDGDNLRYGLNADLGFSPQDRVENIRRAFEVAGLFSRAGMLVITAFISPYASDRTRAREVIGEGFREIHIHADLAVCEARDPRGLYKKAHAGEIADFTGISAPYEAPKQADLLVDTAANDIEECVRMLLAYVEAEFRL